MDRVRVRVRGPLGIPGVGLALPGFHSIGQPRWGQGEHIGLTTVYRTLLLMANAGQLDLIRTDEGETAYRRCSMGHHHHLVGRDCGRTVEVEGPAIERWIDHIADQHGFSDVQHQLEIFGRCSSCADQTAPTSKP